ncbi:MAG: 2-polyprenyl-3-methyl-5-hydroxy-6-metoxy-1,4-benzoquinol methylase [Gammaproteobacteria bacterium]|jgi:2-polyprenyl-3-methyl-5-hydroxy-6-metoxy-1,4-benzoquinol methylase
MNVKKFDEAYYARYYGDRNTRVAEPSYFNNLARYLGAYTRLLGLKVGSIVDLGCGVGTLKLPLLGRFPKATYTGVDISEYACVTYGWERAAVSEYSSPEKFDLVVCHDVVQYLNDKEAKAAIKNFNSLCKDILYFSVLTEEDYVENCDQSRTDSAVNLRTTDWYRPKLQRYFRNLGGGVYLSRDSEIAIYALEHLD